MVSNYSGSPSRLWNPSPVSRTRIAASVVEGKLVGLQACSPAAMLETSQGIKELPLGSIPELKGKGAGAWNGGIVIREHIPMPSVLLAAMASHSGWIMCNNTFIYTHGAFVRCAGEGSSSIEIKASRGEIHLDIPLGIVPLLELLHLRGHFLEFLNWLLVARNTHRAPPQHREWGDKEPTQPGEHSWTTTPALRTEMRGGW